MLPVAGCYGGEGSQSLAWLREQHETSTRLEINRLQQLCLQKLGIGTKAESTTTLQNAEKMCTFTLTFTFTSFCFQGGCGIGGPPDSVFRPSPLAWGCFLATVCFPLSFNAG